MAIRPMATWRCGTRAYRNGLTLYPDDISYRSRSERYDRMAYQVILSRPGVYRILLEERAEGVYVNVFETATSRGPEWDWLQDDLDMAMRSCERRYGVSRDQWVKVPHEGWHAPP
jgi:hypothetical protein